jgi:hypothetical protein
VRASDVIFTQTPGSKPVLEHSWLKPHATIIASGSDQPTKNEIPPEVKRGNEGGREGEREGGRKGGAEAWEGKEAERNGGRKERRGGREEGLEEGREGGNDAGEINHPRPRG